MRSGRLWKRGLYVVERMSSQCSCVARKKKKVGKGQIHETLDIWQNRESTVKLPQAVALNSLQEHQRVSSIKHDYRITGRMVCNMKEAIIVSYLLTASSQARINYGRRGSLERDMGSTVHASILLTRSTCLWYALKELYPMPFHCQSPRYPTLNQKKEGFEGGTERKEVQRYWHLWSQSRKVNKDWWWRPARSSPFMDILSRD